ncbi:hypothetical protein JQ604_10505 [Bradyrhizobium jicamae]|uniref:hypothetical protein n=1 Tax=Bradyrhizobium jicamae TaxID=280332 RepID=UPI001BA5119F|nr:hypothetical protein [Bradyrhizobium jicamae]MBR0752615.1 hypothetical protein [Bradyrhizobium jicamae]
MVARADVAIPERRMKVSLVFQNDTGSGLLGQTVQVSFFVPADFAGGKGVREIQELRMRQTETSIGIPFGRAVQKISDGVFLIGVARDVLTEATSFNRKDWDWITLPLIYGDDQHAQLVVEKGHDGQQAITAMNEQNEKLKLQPQAAPASAATASTQSPKIEKKPPPAKDRTFGVERIAELLNRPAGAAGKTSPAQQQGSSPIPKYIVGYMVPKDPAAAAATRRAFLESVDRVRDSLSKCWRPDKDFKGTLRYRVAIDKDGKVTKVIPFADNKSDPGMQRAANAAIEACQPYVMPISYKNWDSLEVELSQRVDVASAAIVPSENDAKELKVLTVNTNGPLSPSHQEILDLATKIKACLKTNGSGMSGLELHLNRDGSVAPGSRIVSSPTPEIGQNLLQATFDCQPYPLQTEKYEGWKVMFIQF